MTSDLAATDRLTIDGCGLAVTVNGAADNPALVLLHMLGADKTMWDGLVPHLADRYRVVRIDARGHGGSELGVAPVTIERLGRDVLAVLDRLGIARANVCGLSMGGLVAQWLLAFAGTRVERAVIADSAARMGTAAAWNARIASALSDGMEPAVSPAIERWFSPAFAERAPHVVEAMRAMLRATSPQAYAACSGAIRDADLREAVRGVPHPVLVLRGADDPAASAEEAAFMVETMGNARSVELDARHCSCLEAKEAFARAVLEFLAAECAGAGLSSSAGRHGEPKRGTPGARRQDARLPTAARQPVPKSPPASRKAAALASATRKAGARTAPRASEPAPARRRPTPAMKPGGAWGDGHAPPRAGPCTEPGEQADPSTQNAAADVPPGAPEPGREDS